MGISIYQGSIFDTKADAYVNTVNCVGVMGAGIAKEFKTRFPQMFEAYKLECLTDRIKPGDTWVYHTSTPQMMKMDLMNVAVKNHWKQWATREWIDQCFETFKEALHGNFIRTVNTPLWASKNGRRGPLGLPVGYTLPPEPEEMLQLFVEHFKPIDTQVNLFLM